jgi:hypothetical protein
MDSSVLWLDGASLSGVWKYGTDTPGLAVREQGLLGPGVTRQIEPPSETDLLTF